LLTSFLYKAAYITAMKAQGRYRAGAHGLVFRPEQGQIVTNIYETLYTGGIGLNVSSYLQYTGMSEKFSMPADYNFNKLEALVFGTHVDVTCMNVTSEYTIETGVAEATVTKDAVRVTVASRPGGPNFRFAQFYSDDRTLEIESSVVIDHSTDESTLVLAVGGVLQTLILGCKFAGREYLASVSVASLSSPLRLVHEIYQGPVLDPIIQQGLAYTSRALLGHDGVGVVGGFLDAGYPGLIPNETLITSLQTVLEQLSEAHISITRQTVERSNAHVVGGNAGVMNGSRLQLYVTLVRLGGASYGWLAVPVALLLGTVVGIVRICTYRTMAELEAQDAVKLLQSTLQNAAISDTSRI
jgi:hypothetical protein